MSFMDTFERGMEKILVPVAIKLNSQIHVSAIRDAFILSFPIVMASSLIILINFAILSPDGFIASILHLGAIFPHLAEAQQIFTPVMNGSVNIMAILITFLVARNMAISYQQDDLLCGLTAIGAFFVVYTPYTIIDGQAYLATKYLGPQGLFVAIIVALISSELFCRLARNPRVTITMPAAVPPAVARSFKVLLPIFFVMIFFSILNYLLTRISPNGLNDLIYTLIQAPLKDMGTNIVTVSGAGAGSEFPVGAGDPWSEHRGRHPRDHLLGSQPRKPLLCRLAWQHLGGTVPHYLDWHQRCVCQLRRVWYDAGPVTGHLYCLTAQRLS